MNNQVAECMAKNLTENSVKDLHDAIAKALLYDDMNPNKDYPYYGVREYQDWMDWKNILENAMIERKIPFQAINL
jgi:hypothetical protein